VIPATDQKQSNNTQQKTDPNFDDCMALMGSKDLVHALVRKTADYVNFISASGRLWTWRSVNYQMNSGLYYGGQTGRSGAMGEIVVFRNLVANTRSMGAGRPKFGL
jgi:hypothetical protein